MTFDLWAEKIREIFLERGFLVVSGEDVWEQIDHHDPWHATNSENNKMLFTTAYMNAFKLSISLRTPADWLEMAETYFDQNSLPGGNASTFSGVNRREVVMSIDLNSE